MSNLRTSFVENWKGNLLYGLVLGGIGYLTLVGGLGSLFAVNYKQDYYNSCLKTEDVQYCNNTMTIQNILFNEMTPILIMLPLLGFGVLIFAYDKRIKKLKKIT